MIPFQTSITVNRPVDEVFQFVADPQNYPRWMSGLTKSEPLSPNPIRVGSQVRLVGKMGMWKFDGPMEITEYEPDRTFGIASTIAGAMHFQATWRFEPTGPTTTRIAESGQARLLGMWRLLEALFAGEVKQGEANELSKIKTLLENQQ